MRWMFRALGIVGVMLVGAGAASVLLASCAAGLNEAPLAEDEAEAPVVAILHTRDRELTITGGSRGMRYSLVGLDGELHEGLTLEQLAERDRELYEMVKSAMARSGGAPVLDARVGNMGGPSEPSADRNRLKPELANPRR